MFFVAILLLVVAVVAILVGKFGTFESATGAEKTKGSKTATRIGIGVFVLSLAFAALSSLYTQGAGEAKVQVDWTGNIVGSTTNSGLHFKAPWVKTVTYDIRNNTVTYVGDGSTDYSAGSATGQQITVQDKDGTSANVDIVVRYSIDPSDVERIFAQFGTQEAFVNRVITNDVRSVTRDVPSGYTALSFLNNREEAGNEIQVELEKRWESEGVLVDEVQLQEIRYDESVRARFNEAQNARTAIAQAQAELETARVNAEKAAAEAQGRADAARIEAQGQADANALLAASLTPEILQQRYLDALKAGTVFVVPEGSAPLVSVPGPR